MKHKEKELKIVADKQIPFLKGILEPHAAIRYIEGKAITSSVIVDADALLVRTRTQCNQALLDNTNVRFIASATSGTDHVDESYCTQNGIEFRNAPGCNASAVAQYVSSALVFLLGKEKISPPGVTLGIVGLGHVGQQVYHKANAMGMKVLVNDPPRARREKTEQYVNLDYLLDHADIVTVHVPLNNSGSDKTLHLIDKEFLGKMKSGSWLINTSRGEVAATSDLLEAPSDRKFILDVWENEPDLNRDLLSGADLATSHIAGYTVNGKANATQTIVRELSRFFELGLDNFVPKIPLPSHNRVIPQGNNEFRKLQSAIFQSYNILFDDQLLRNNPGDFEKNRKDYRRRWEFKNYTVQVNSEEKQLASWIGNMGFNLQFR